MEEIATYESVHPAHYRRVHQWMSYHYGSANKCEGDNCKKISQKYDWALIHGKKYEKNRDNFKQLCKSCHGLYDITDIKRIRVGAKNRNKTHCMRGHEFTEENTVRDYSKTRHIFLRHCITCNKMRRKIYQKIKSEKIREINLHLRKECSICKKSFKPRGLAPHMRSHENLPLDAK